MLIIIETNVYTIVQKTGEVTEITEKVERKDGMTHKHYTIKVKEMDDLDDLNEFVKASIIH